ncbi:MAG: beta-glucuronidase [Epulopiscium sp.]|nr:beta-glucuronidase [Candidatus Epulonipiscium sp.]
MIRGFMMHEIRKEVELDGLWVFQPCEGEGKDKTYKMSVPSCWESHPEFINYRGKGYYKKEIQAKGNIRLVFKGVSHTAKVFWNGEIVANHYNAYTPFEVVIRGAEDQKHELMVEVDNSFTAESSLHIPNDYHTYGGIIRPVAFQVIPDAYIQYVHFTPFKKNNQWHGKIEVAVENIGEKDQLVYLKTCISEMEYEFKEKIAIAGETVLFSEEFEFKDVKNYELEDPVLYLLKTNLYIEKDTKPVDDLIERIGFREIKIRGKDLYFNDTKVKIKGFNRHEDHGHFGSSIPYQAMMADLHQILDMGGNAIRTAHYPNDERFLDLCDELGILVWEESHARGLSEEQMRHKNFDQQSEDSIREMIMNHYNHPSIFVWGILNECASYTRYGRECYEKQFKQIKSLDQSRPTTFASCHYHRDICLDLPDIVSFNIYPGWYEQEPKGSEEFTNNEVYSWVQRATEGKGKPYIISEIGAGAIYGYRTMRKSKWSEEWQAETLERQLEAVLSHEEMTGVFVWQYCDCRVSDEWFYARPRTMNNKGVVDEFRRPKMAYEVVKRIFHSY